MRLSCTIPGVMVVLLLGGCVTGGGPEVVLSRANYDLECQRSDITLDVIGSCMFVARGCGGEATYIVRPIGAPGMLGDCCPIGSGCTAVLNSEIRSKASAAPDVRSDLGPPEVRSDAAAPDVSSDAPARGEPGRPKHSFPEGAAGFTFGSGPDAAAVTCTGAGHAWEEQASESAFLCGGAPKQIGLDAAVEVRFCDGSLCQLDVLAKPSQAGWTKSFLSLRSALEERYGAPGVQHAVIPSECRDQIGQCLAAGQAAAWVTWQWASGNQIKLAMGKRKGEPIILITYKRAIVEAPPAL